MAVIDELTDADIDDVLKSFDQTSEPLRRRVVASFALRLMLLTGAASAAVEEYLRFTGKDRTLSIPSMDALAEVVAEIEGDD